MTNAVKHAHARAVQVALRREDDRVVLEVGDDGIGGARPGDGSGLVGLADRVQALGGRLDLSSPPGSGTRIVVTLPVDARERASASWSSDGG